MVRVDNDDYDIVLFILIYIDIHTHICLSFQTGVRQVASVFLFPLGEFFYG